MTKYTKENKLEMVTLKIELVNGFIDAHAKDEHWFGLIANYQYFKLLKMSLPKAAQLWYEQNIPL